MRYPFNAYMTNQSLAWGSWNMNFLGKKQNESRHTTDLGVINIKEINHFALGAHWDFIAEISWTLSTHQSLL